MVQSVELKFNCFLLMPVVDAFPSRLRAELEVRTLGCNACATCRMRAMDSHPGMTGMPLREQCRVLHVP